MKKIFLILLSLVGFVTHSLRADTVIITKEQANDANNPILISLGSNFEISLPGKESNSKMYSSGTGSQHGYRWEYESSESDLATITSAPDAIIHSSFPNSAEIDDGWNTTPLTYSWNFLSTKPGFMTLTFKKYYYSNAKVRELDGSLPWKDPVETIQFTIHVVDGTLVSAR